MTESVKFHDSANMILPDIGYINDGTAFGEIGDVHRFSNPSKRWHLPVWAHLYTSSKIFMPDRHGCRNATPVFSDMPCSTQLTM